MSFLKSISIAGAVASPVLPHAKLSSEFCLLVMLNTDLGVFYQLITGARLWLHNWQWFKSGMGVWIDELLWMLAVE